MMNKTSFVL